MGEMPVSTLLGVLILAAVLLGTAAVPAALAFLAAALTRREKAELAPPLPAGISRAQWLVVAAGALALFALATYAGYTTFHSSPEGILLYTPGPNARPIYTPAFQAGFVLVLAAGAAASLLSALLALLVRLLSPTPSTARTAAHQSLKALLLLGAVCGAGAFGIGLM